MRGLLGEFHEKYPRVIWVPVFCEGARIHRQNSEKSVILSDLASSTNFRLKLKAEAAIIIGLLLKSPI